MSDSEKFGKSGGIGVFGLLGVAFVVLKLCHVIDWSWWLVLLPFYGGLVLILGLLLILALCAGLASTSSGVKKR